MKTILITFLASLCLAGCATKDTTGAIGRKPKNGYVPDEKTAIAIAVAVWIPIFGEKQIAGEKPYRAELVSGVWHVFGSIPPTMQGGVAEAQISKEHGTILAIAHSQ